MAIAQHRYPKQERACSGQQGDLPRGAPRISLRNSLFFHNASLFASKNSLFGILGNCLRKSLKRREEMAAPWLWAFDFRLIRCFFPCYQGIWGWETGCDGVRPPPRSPAQIRFPCAVGIVFNFPRLWCERHKRGQSPSRGTGRRDRIIPTQSLPSPNPFPAGIDGGNGDRFDHRLRLVRVCATPAAATSSAHRN